MLRLEDFKKDKEVYYSDFGDKSYSKIKLIKITKIKKDNFWFTAKIIDNSHIKNKNYNIIDSVHSYSNGFIYNSLEELIKGEKEYIKTQIIWFSGGGYKLFIK